METKRYVWRVMKIGWAPMLLVTVIFSVWAELISKDPNIGWGYLFIFYPLYLYAVIVSIVVLVKAKRDGNSVFKLFLYLAGVSIVMLVVPGIIAFLISLIVSPLN